MNRKIKLTAADDHSLDAWRADPDTKAKGGIVVLHAVYGLTDHIGDVCQVYADNGYAAIAPALYDRIEANIVHPYTQDGVEAGRQSYTAHVDTIWVWHGHQCYKHGAKVWRNDINNTFGPPLPQVQSWWG